MALTVFNLLLTLHLMSQTSATTAPPVTTLDPGNVHKNVVVEPLDSQSTILTAWQDASAEVTGSGSISTLPWVPAKFTGRYTLAVSFGSQKPFSRRPKLPLRWS
ncbi:hypothetical protein Bbelb_283770 [Branchiostoma belcheri]|nr:hypothetical protein Bbelb_283770 [Branchiostoma belcheri]